MIDASSAPSAAPRRARNARSMLLMFAATLVMVVMHTAVRHLGRHMPVSAA